MESLELRQECLEYFKARPVFRKLFEKMRAKYVGLGRLGGTVTLNGLTAEEKQQLGGFFQKDYAENKAVTVSGKLMEKALGSSRFAGLSWEEILEGYFGEPLVARKDLKQQKERTREMFFRAILDECAENRGKAWLETVLSGHGGGYAMILQQYKENPQKLKDTLQNVLKGIGRLPAFCGEAQGDPGKKELLPVFAANVTGDPHYFDQGTAGERLLTAFLESDFGEHKNRSAFAGNRSGLSAAEYKKKLFYEAGILKDELSNDVLAYGIRGWRNNGEEHKGIQGFYSMKEPVKLTLQTLGGLSSIRGADQAPVYVVENPAVFSILVRQYPNRTFICGNGQVNLAVLVLMDQLAEHHTFRYAGDFDPEGLLIAQRLKLRYEDKLQFWNYQTELYEAYKSNVTLNAERLKKLERVVLPELEEIKKALKKEKRAAYQEAMIERMRI